MGAGGTGETADATRTARSAGTAFTVATLTFTGGGNGGAVANCAATPFTPPCANVTSRAESKSLVNFP